MSSKQLSLLAPPSGGACSVSSVNGLLAERHYLGPSWRGFAWSDEFGVAVFAPPTSRRLPGDWLELVRWCLYGKRNGGSQQWKRMRSWLRQTRPEVTTVVSYSDPSAGHTGSLYKACGWQWAPTWHRLRPPPSGNGSWGKRTEAVKDRWVYALAADPRRDEVLRVKDDSPRVRKALESR